MKKNKQRVWDAPVRLLHWALVATMAAAWATSDSTSGVHEYLGYGTLAIVASRLAWGFAGNRYARFAHFVRGPGPTLAYLRAVRDARAPRHLGHNPLGAAMVLALLCCVVLLGVSGWMLGTDLLWGYAWPVQLHYAIACLLVGLVVLHVAGVLFTSWQHRENLVAAMVTGEKDAAAPGDQD